MSKMKERVTFVHQDPDLDPEALDIQDAGLLGPQVDAVRQDRLTIPVDELPQNLADFLNTLESVHIRWASPSKYETLDPFASRFSPGLHVAYTPRHTKSKEPLPHSNVSPKLCAWLQRFGPLDCSTPKNFTEYIKNPAYLGNKGVPPPPDYYFYQNLEDLHSFVTSITKDFCPELDPICHARARSLYNAATLELSYETALETFVLTAAWPFQAQVLSVPTSSDRRVEVGIFMNDNTQPNIQDYELGLAGVLTVISDKKQPSPAMFTFPSRHRKADSTFSSKFLTPTGLHPTLHLSIASSHSPMKDVQCTPYAYLTLPKIIFADRYQLADELFLASMNLTASQSTTLPVDLEAPAYTTDTWGSSVLVGLAPPGVKSGQDQDQDQAWTAEIPLHLRYLKPSVGGEVEVEVPYPAVFWACSTDSSQLENPFDRLHLGYDALFPRNTTFWHLSPQPEVGNRLMNPIFVPVLKEDGAAWIRLGTSIAIALGFSWVLLELIGAMTRKSSGRTKFGPARATPKKAK